METFENHQTFNKYLSIEGYRVNTSGSTPSVYITEMKLKKTVKELTGVEIEDIFEKEMSELAINNHREKLASKIESLHKWQLFKALDIWLEVGRIEAIEYVRKCKKTDKSS